MFEAVIEEAEKRYRIVFSDAATTFLHYCIVRGSEFVLDRSRSIRPIDESRIRLAMWMQVEMLGKRLGKLEGVVRGEPAESVGSLFKFVADQKKVSINEKGLKFGVQFVSGATVAIILTASVHASDRTGRTSPKTAQPRIVEPRDIEHATEEIFEQGWFWW